MDLVLIHGAFHGGWCWRAVADRLRARGHRVYAPTLTGLADRIHLFSARVDLRTHVDDVTSLIVSERLDGCVLVGHSYGGNVITGVADRLRERVAEYVYLDAVVPPDDATRWRWADFNTAAERAARLELIRTRGYGLFLPPPPASTFGIGDPGLAAEVDARLTPMPAGTYLEPIELSAGGSSGLRRRYIAAAAPAYDPMRAVVSRVRAGGWRFDEIATGHDAMVTAPERLAELISA